MHPIVNIADLEPISRSAMSAKGGVSSSPARFDVCEYPDSNKFAVWDESGSDAQGFRFVGSGTSSLDDWDGE